MYQLYFHLKKKNIKNKKLQSCRLLKHQRTSGKRGDVCSKSQQEITFVSDRGTARKSKPTQSSHKYGREGGQSRQRPRQTGQATVGPACALNKASMTQELGSVRQPQTQLQKTMFSRCGPLSDHSKLLYQTSACTLSLKMMPCSQSASIWERDRHRGRDISPTF